MYWEAITVIEAQETLLQLNIADFPYMKDNKRREFFKDLKSKAYIKFKKDDSPGMSLGDFAQILAGKS